MKKFKYIDRDSGELYYGDVAISDVPNLDDKIVNYDSHLSNNDIHVTATNKSDWNTHIADTVKHVTSSDKTSWNGHIANNDIHVTLAKKTSWDNHIADSNIHVTTAEKAFWNSSTGGLKPFTNFIYVDSSFPNSAPYFNNLTDAINSATANSLIVVNGNLNLPTTINKSLTFYGVGKGSSITFTAAWNNGNAITVYGCSIFSQYALQGSLVAYGTGRETISVSDAHSLSIRDYSFVNLSGNVINLNIYNCQSVRLNQTTTAKHTLDRISTLEATYIFNIVQNSVVKITNISKCWAPYSAAADPRLFYSPNSNSAGSDKLRAKNINLIWAKYANLPVIEVGTALSPAYQFPLYFENCKFLLEGTGANSRILKVYSAYIIPLINCVLAYDNDSTGALCEGSGLLLKNTCGAGAILNTTSGDPFLNNANFSYLRFWEIAD